MGIWDDLQSSASRLFNSAKRPSASNSSLAGDPPTVTKVTDVAQKSDDFVRDSQRREKIGRILNNLGKFAVDSAVNDSLKGVSPGGAQVYKLVKDGLKHQPVSRPSYGTKKQDLMIAMEEMQAKMEKMQEDVNILKQQSHISADYSDDFDPLKDCCDEPMKSSDSSETSKKKIFIRSRL